MKPKPRITKADDGWQVERPRVGFGAAEVRSGFPTREAAGAWLADIGRLGSSPGSYERTKTPNGQGGWFHEDPWPVIIR